MTRNACEGQEKILRPDWKISLPALSDPGPGALGRAPTLFDLDHE